MTARSTVHRLKGRLGYVATFLAGAVVAMIPATAPDSPELGNAPHPPEAHTPGSPSILLSGRAELQPGAAPAATGSRALLGADFACHPHPGESAQEEFQRVLRELVQAPLAERQERLALLLARLKQRGADSVPVILSYLREGRNVEPGTLWGEVAFLGGSSHYKSLRTFLYLTLAQLADAHPASRSQIAAQGLEHAHHLHEALALASAASADTATQQQAVTTIQRLATDATMGNHFHDLLQAMVQLQSPELLTHLGAYIEKHPYNHGVEGFLGALWSYPDDVRLELSRRLVASEEVRRKLHGSPAAWQWLDMRDSSLRGAVVQDFQALAFSASDHAQHAQLTFLQRLSENREDARSRYHKFPIGSATPRPGAPDSREQMAARLVLLEEIGRFCSTPLLQAHHAEARARLSALLGRP